MLLQGLFLSQRKMDDYDTQVVEEADDICRVLSLKPQIKRLLWADRVNSDDCRFALGLASFPDRMKGRLEPKEWRPLIASTLIYRKIIARNPPGSAVVAIAVLFVLLVGGAGILSAIFGSSAVGLPFFLYLVFVGGPFFANRITQGAKNQRLQADLEAARVFGKEELLSVLRKIDGMGMRDVIETEKRRFSRHFSSKPSVAERITKVSLWQSAQS
jgi:hypothetical protein